jgi:hypothetical protein
LISQKEALDLCTPPREQWTPVDEMLYSGEDFFNIPKNRAASLMLEAIKYAFHYQYSHNAVYRNYCQMEGVEPDDIKETADLIKIPKVPDTFFKDYPDIKSKEFLFWLRDISAADLGDLNFDKNLSQDKVLDEIETQARGFVLHSSGTSGRFSIIIRDMIGSQRWVYTLLKTCIFGVVSPSDDSHIIYLGSPKTHLAMGRIMDTLNMIFQTSNIHYLTDKKVTMDMINVALGFKKGFRESLQLYLIRLALDRVRKRVIRLLQTLDNERKQVYIITPPFELYALLVMLQKRGIKLKLGDSNSIVITAAGWKTFEGNRVSEEKFRSMVEDILGIPHKHCRDLYAMSEWHGLAWECEGHYKHIIQYTYPMVLDENLKPLDYGQYGRFAFLDPLSNTFPGFIITGDRVRMLQNCPVCDWSSPVLEPEITRMAGAESRGCGELMVRMMAEDLAKAKR